MCCGVIDYLSPYSFDPCTIPRLSPLRCNTCVLGAALGTRGRRHGLPIKAFRGGKSNRCILKTVQRNHLHTPTLCGLLSPPPNRETLPGHAERAPPSQKAGASSDCDCDCASDSAFAGAAGSGCRGRAGVRAAVRRASLVARAGTRTQ